MRPRALAAICLVVCSACASRDRQLDELYRSASQAMLQGDLAQARSLSERGIAAAGTRDSPTRWKFALLKDEILVISRDLRAGFSALDHVVPASSQFAWVRAKQQSLNGQRQLVQGKFADAVATLKDASELAAAANAVDVRLDSETLKGVALMRLGQTDAGDAALAEVATAARAAGDKFREASAVLNRGMGYVLRNRYDEALPFFEQVIAMRDLASLMVYAHALRNAAVSYARLGDFDRAITAARRSVEVNEHRGPPVYLEQALGVLGATYALKGSHREAIEYLRRALKVATDAKLYEDAARWADNLSTAYASLDAWSDAETANAEAKRLNELAGTRTFIYNTYHRAQIAAGKGDLSEAERLFQLVLSDEALTPALQWEVQAELGQLDARSGRARAAAQHFNAALAVIERTRSELLGTDYKLSFLTRLIDFYDGYIDLLQQQGDYDTALRVADSSRARVLAERHDAALPASTTAAAFRRTAARLNSVLLFYWIGGAKSYAWAVTAQGIHFVRLNTNATEVEHLVREYQKQIVSSLGDPLTSAATGDRLYATLIAPVASWIPHGGRVIVMPDGALNTLNFETLTVPGERRHYWIEDVEVTVAPSLGTLTSSSPATQDRDPSVLVVGDPLSSDPQYPKLRYASAEIAAVSNAFQGRTSVYRANEATPARYRESDPGQFGIVHFAAHAAANANSPLDSAVVLSPDGSGYKLYARDVAAHRLSAELVTISACRSAGERAYAGEGLVGFAWAFLRAGARRVIAGLWDVDDRSTAALMGRLYALIAEGQTPATALRTAKLEMIARGGAAAKPYYWAPFQLFVGSQVTP